MNSVNETFVLYALGAVALAVLLPGLKMRLELSKAKHPSLSGHSRMARRIAALLPFYEYDDAISSAPTMLPTQIAAHAVRRLHAACRTLSRTLCQHAATLTAEVEDSISDLQFTGAYRVPFQYSGFVRRHLQGGWICRSSSGVTVTDLDGNPFYDLTGSYGVNVFGYDFYKECIERGWRACARAGPGARRLSSGRGLQRAPAERDLRA